VFFSLPTHDVRAVFLVATVFVMTVFLVTNVLVVTVFLVTTVFVVNVKVHNTCYDPERHKSRHGPESRSNASSPEMLTCEPSCDVTWKANSDYIQPRHTK
jgi:hypothetical protein